MEAPGRAAIMGGKHDGGGTRKQKWRRRKRRRRGSARPRDARRFQIENTLPEIIQVTYRGRGGPAGAAPKEIVFYISNRIVTTREEREMAARESALDTLNLLILLKAAVMTRIARAGQIHSERISVIPIGARGSRRRAGPSMTG
jgi:hypothetical protein